MKRRKRWIAYALFLPLLLSACDNFERNAYRTLKVAKVEYELLQGHAARAFVHGRMAPAQWERFALAGNRFIAAHTFAADLLASYQHVQRSGTEDDRRALQQRIITALAELPVLLAGLKTFLELTDTTGATLSPDPIPLRKMPAEAPISHSP